MKGLLDPLSEETLKVNLQLADTWRLLLGRDSSRSLSWILSNLEKVCVLNHSTRRFCHALLPFERIRRRRRIC